MCIRDRYHFIPLSLCLSLTFYSYVFLSKHHFAKLSLPPPQNRIFRTARHTRRKKRFSRICRNPSCHPRHNFCLLLAQEWGIQRANRQEARKPQRRFTFHCAILISTTSDLQIEKKRAIYALPHTGFYPSARHRTDVFSTSCGEKKCFFSSTKNYLAVLDASTSLTKIKIRPKMQKNI